MFRYVLCLLVIGFFVWGCGGGSADSGGAKTGPVAGPGNGSATRGQIILRHTLARAIPTNVTDLRLTGKDRSGSIVFGPELRPVAQEIVLDVPRSLAVLEVEYLDAGLLLAVGTVNVDLSSVQVVVITDPDYLTAVTSLSLSPTALRSYSCSERRIQAVGLLGDGQTRRDVTQEATWESSNPAVVTASNQPHTKGLVRVVGPGQAEVRCHLGSMVASIVVESIGPGVFHGFDGPQDYPTGHLLINEIALADLNGDASPDVLATTTDTNQASLLPGRPDGSLGPPQPLDLGPGPTSPRLADLNSDGTLDIVWGETGKNSVGARLGNGDGTFGPILESPLPFVPGHTWLAVGKLDADGFPDVAIATADTMCVCLSNGDGTFVPGGPQPVLPSVQNLLIADVTGDGSNDLVMASRSTSTPFPPAGLTLFPGNGNGTLQAGQNLFPGAGTVGLTAGDLDRDGRLDLVTGDIYARSIVILRSLGGGAFFNTQTLAALHDPNSIAVSDLNRDGVPDLVSSGAAWLGQGDATFTNDLPAPKFPAADRVFAADVNGDGIPDLVYPGPTVASVGVAQGVGDGNFRLQRPLVGVGSALATLHTDLNLDGFEDLLVRDNATGDWNSFLGVGDGSFNLLQSLVIGPGGRDTMASGDLDGDGVPDLIATNPIGAQVASYRGLGNGTFTQVGSVVAGTQPGRVVLGDWNMDGRLDAAAGDETGGDVSLLRGSGDGSLTLVGTLAAGTNPFCLDAGDFNGDGRVDLANRAAVGGATLIKIHLSNGDGSFQAGASISAENPQVVRACDLDDDGNLDLAVLVGTSNPGNLRVCRGNGDGSFQPPEDVGAPQSAIFLEVGDVNFDCRDDLILTTPGSTVMAYLSQPGGGLGSPILISCPAETGPAAVADFDSDSRPDLLLPGLYGPTGVLLPGH